MRVGNYENFLIMEQEGRAAYQLGDTNCSDCNQQICACESLAEWFTERDADLDAAQAISAEAPARSEPADFLGRVGSVSAVSPACKSDKTGSGGDVCVPAPSEFPLQLMDRPRSFSEWLERHGDNLRLPTSFREWIEQGDDAIRQANRDEAYLDQGHLHT